MWYLLFNIYSNMCEYLQQIQTIISLTFDGLNVSVSHYHKPQTHKSIFVYLCTTFIVSWINYLLHIVTSKQIIHNYKILLLPFKDLISYSYNIFIGIKFSKDRMKLNSLRQCMNISSAENDTDHSSLCVLGLS